VAEFHAELSNQSPTAPADQQPAASEAAAPLDTSTGPVSPSASPLQPEPLIALITDLARQSDRLRSIARGATDGNFGPPEFRADLFGALAHLDHLAADLHHAVAPE